MHLNIAKIIHEMRDNALDTSINKALDKSSIREEVTKSRASAKVDTTS